MTDALRYKLSVVTSPSNSWRRGAVHGVQRGAA
jgi:hypothetical protein